MSQTELLKTMKLCAVCQFWEGDRKVSINKNVNCDTGAKGKCVISSGPLKGQDRLYNNSPCSKFSKWDKLP